MDVHDAKRFNFFGSCRLAEIIDRPACLAEGMDHLIYAVQYICTSRQVLSGIYTTAEPLLPVSKFSHVDIEPWDGHQQRNLQIGHPLTSREYDRTPL